MKLVVVESPLAGDFERNRRYALWCAYDCFFLDEAAYASHLFYPQFLNDTNPEHREFGITAGLLWASHADIIAFYVDLGMSKGMERAWKHWNEPGESRVRVVEKRMLPRNYMAAFEAGELPSTTPGF